ncbi:MAG: hypothetical protein GMKNLPBB_03400 [Myxococcota bacterium]|nr:hypothetical protein [Myxococcota bacterium]
MAGYSGTPLPKKLGVRENSRVALVHAPGGFELPADNMPAGAAVQSGLGGKDPLDVIVTPALAARFSRMLPRSRLMIQPGATHYGPIEFPGEYAAELKSLLSEAGMAAA